MTIRVERILEVKIATPRLVALLRFVSRRRCGCLLSRGILLFSASAPAQELKKIVVAYVAPIAGNFDYAMAGVTMRVLPLTRTVWASEKSGFIWELYQTTAKP